MNTTLMMDVMLIAGISWLLLRHGRSARAGTRVSAPAVRAVRGTVALGLEDDPDLWPAARGAWTALDERQMTRLLQDSAPVEGPAVNPTNAPVSHVEDTP
ncbi:hypothetical protein [Tsukamurella soli]|uniref:Uncharacterized protein n=1 Tax=Tsukamurella soli TaxID=644556 RepID=A0ABP8JWL6_9ACTN